MEKERIKINLWVEFGEAFERMFIRGGRRDNLLSFLLGQTYLIIVSVCISALAINYLSGKELLGPFNLLVKQYGEINIALFLALLIWVHEMSHQALFRQYGVPTFGLILPPLGGIMVPGRKISPQQNIVVALAGPLSGVAALPMLIIGALLNQPIWIFLGFVWASVNLINLLPLYPLDGGWVVKELLSRWLSPKTALRTSWAITILTMGALYLLISNPAIFVLQVVLVAMMVVADALGGRVFSWFSEKHLDSNTSNQVSELTNRQVLNGAACYIALLHYLGILSWLALLLLPIKLS
jgi:Zn-dependent protease